MPQKQEKDTKLTKNTNQKNYLFEYNALSPEKLGEKTNVK